MKYSIIICIALASLGLSCQDQNVDINKYPALKIAKETSLFRDEVNWDDIIIEYAALSNSEQGKTAQYEYLLNSLGDEHGVFRNASTYQVIASCSKKIAKTREFDAEFMNEVINDRDARFSYAEIERIGYLKVVGIGPQFPMEEDAGLIQNAIAELKASGINKWILDLRFNGGGNMNPMLSGLSSLLGSGNIGGSIDKSGNVLQSFKIENGRFYDTDNLVIDIENPQKEDIIDSVAVLLSRYTASSGELVAVAFKGRKNTRFFGERTQGLTTVTGFDRLDDETIMLLSLAYYEDRDGNIYTDGVQADEEIMFDEFSQFEKDEILEQSIRWLKN